ncbi:hypothetical protein [Clostridium estertheticum]|nr:hypothetical protein [Clostridium estertheticum]MBZ9613991.1 hypothetical protein [Clostridium estertheticum subsp. laramiense]WAG73947.1 hypothetical protein LL032_00350 [Clostridium estertheticum]
MNDIKIISEVGICLWIIWNMTRKILFGYSVRLCIFRFDWNIYYGLYS